MLARSLIGTEQYCFQASNLTDKTAHPRFQVVMIRNCLFPIWRPAGTFRSSLGRQDSPALSSGKTGILLEIGRPPGEVTHQIDHRSGARESRWRKLWIFSQGVPEKISNGIHMLTS